MVLSRLMLPYPFHIYIKIRYLLNVLTELARSDSDPDRYDERIIINYSGKFFRWSHQCLLESKWKTLQIGALSFHQCFEITHTQCNQWALMQKQKRSARKQRHNCRPQNKHRKQSSSDTRGKSSNSVSIAL